VTERRNILIIDDDRSWQAFLSVALRDEYNIIAAFDGHSGLELAAECLPDTILLDVEMPIKNGYEVCTALKADEQLQDIPIIFVSSKVSLQEKIMGFKLGADDYVVKPCEVELLSVKIDRSSMLYREKKSLDQKASGAQVLAFEAMNSNADLGRSLRFAERTYSMPNLDKLAEALFQTMDEFGLETSVMFITPSGPQFYAQNKYELSPLEKDMFLAIHQQGRFVDFGSHTFCNFPLVSLLVKNMPLSAPERYGRIKDTVPWIVGVMEGKVSALELQNILIAHNKVISSSIKTIDASLKMVLEKLEAKIFTDLTKRDIGTHLTSAVSNLSELSLKQANLDLHIQENLTGDSLSGRKANEIGSTDVDFF